MKEYREFENKIEYIEDGNKCWITKFKYTNGKTTFEILKHDGKLWLYSMNKLPGNSYSVLKKQQPQLFT